MRLVNGSHIAIIGGGPAGCFTALNLARFAAERRLELHITILEGRVFEKPGPAGCNKCAGILSSELVRKAVGAFGMDDGTANVFSRVVGYHQPPAMSSIVTKYHPGESSMAEFGNRIHAFLPPLSQIEFAGITPKSNHLTINIAGTQVTTDWMDVFIKLPEVQRTLPDLGNAGRFDSNDMRYFKGRFPCGLAQKFYGERFVMVGDAAGLVRPFKGKGITSAIITGTRAAQVIFRQGISALAFEAYRCANQDILSDLPYGQAMRRITILASRVGFMDTVVKAAENSPQLYQALFDAVSAHHAYKLVIGRTFTPASIWAITRALIGLS